MDYPEQTQLAFLDSGMVRKFHLLGIHRIEDLRGQDPQNLYERLCRKTEQCHDPGLVKLFEDAIDKAKGQDQRLRWEKGSSSSDDSLVQLA